MGEETSSALIDNKIPQFSFSLSTTSAFKQNACCLGVHDFVPIRGKARHFLTEVLRVWHLHCRQRDSFAPERQVKNCSVLSSPWHPCMLLKHPGSCCQALYHCLPAPKVLNALAFPTVGLLQEWMKQFPGQDFMNERACVLQGNRLCAFPRLREHMLRGSCLSFQQECWGGGGTKRQRDCTRKFVHWGTIQDIRARAEVASHMWTGAGPGSGGGDTAVGRVQFIRKQGQRCRCGRLLRRGGTARYLM